MPQRADKRPPDGNLSNIFISYSREDQDFVRALAEEFQRAGSTIWIDRKDVERTRERELELIARIEAADNVVVVISPESVSSEELARELAHAVKYGKRLVPVVRGEVAAALLPQPLTALDPIRLRPKDDIRSACRTLTKRIDADLKLDLFISYSRKDEKFVRELEDALHVAGRKLWIDRRNIRYTEEWLKAIYSGIEAADNFVFVISPDSVVSENCGRELSHAVEHNKRLVPIIHREVDPHSVPRPLADLDWVPFRHTDDFKSAFNKLLDAIDTDLDYVRAHTRLLVRAIEWEKAGRDKSLLLRGANLHEAVRWLMRAGSVQKPHVTTLQSQYITLSRQDTNRRQRITVSALTAGLVVAVVLALLSIYQYKIAEAQRNEAKRRLAALYEEQGRQELLGGRPTRALVYLNEALQEGGDTLSLRFMLAHALHSLDGQTATLNEHTQGLTAVAATRDGRRIVTGSDDGTARVWDAASGEVLLTLQAHGGGVKSVAFSRGEEEILTAGVDHRARVWDARSGELRADLARHEKTVNSASFSNDGRHIVTASDDGTAIVWEAKGGRFLFQMGDRYWPVTLAVFSPDDRLILTATADAVSLAAFTFDAGFVLGTNNEPTAYVWDVADMRKVKLRFKIRDYHGGWITGAFSPDSRSIVTGGYFDRSAIVWDARSGRQRARLTDDKTSHGGPITSAAFSHDGKFILTASWDGTAKVWDAATGGQTLVLKGRTDRVNSAAFSGDDRYVVTAGESGATEVWDANEGRLFATLGGHTNAVVAAVFAGAGERLVTAGADRRAIVWDWKAARTTVPVLLDHQTGPRWAINEHFVAFSPDSRLVVASGSDGNAKIWQAADGRPLTTLHSDTNVGAEVGVGSAVFTPDGRRILTVSTSGVARMWEVSDGKLVYALEGHDGISNPAGRGKAVNSAVFDKDGRHLLTAEGDMTSKIWDARTGVQLLALKGHEGAVNSAAFSPDGARVVTASDDGTVKLWDAANGALLKTFAAVTNNSFPALSAAFSPDGSRILTMSGERVAVLWDAHSGQLLATLGGHTGKVTAAVFGPDGGRIVTASLDNKARIWDGRSGSLLFTLEGHTGSVMFSIFGADGLLVATVSNDKTVRIWDVPSGRCLATLTGHTDLIGSIAYSPDKTRLATASRDGIALVWDVHLETRSPEEIDALVKRHVPMGVEGGGRLPVVRPEGVNR